MSDTEKKEVKSGFGGCYYFEFNLFTKRKHHFYCKKKDTHDFKCDGCVYNKPVKRYK